MAGWEQFLHLCCLPRKGEEFRQFAADILEGHSNYSRDQFGAERPYSGTGCNGPQRSDGGEMVSSEACIDCQHIRVIDHYGLSCLA